MLKKRLGLNAIGKNWVMSGHLLNYYFKVSSTLIIPEGCKWIGHFAFWKCENLRKVVIAGSVEVIQDFAFDGCKNAIIILKKPKSEFKYIGDQAFRYCKDVKEEVRN